MYKGDFDQIYLKGNNNYLLILKVGYDMLLMVSTTTEVRLGLILLNLRYICERISQLEPFFVEGDEDDDEEIKDILRYWIS